MAPAVTSVDVTAEQWLAYWTDLGNARMGRFKALAGAFGAAIGALRQRLRDLVGRETSAKASINATAELRAAALRIGARDVADQLADLLAREKAMAGSLDSDARRIRRTIYQTGMYDALDEGDNR